MPRTPRGAALRPGRRRDTPAAAMGGLVLVIVLAVAVVVALVAPRAASAQQSSTASGSVRITVTELTGVLGPGTVRSSTEEFPLPEGPDELRLRLLVENDGDVPLDALRVITEVYGPASNRAALHRALDGDHDGAPLHVHTSEGIGGNGRLQPGAVVGVADLFGPDEVDWAEGHGGVHPVRIAVVRGTEVLDEVVTATIWLGSTPVSPLLTTMVLPLDASPWRTSGGAYPDAAGRETRPGGRLDALLAAAERARGIPLVLAPAAHLLEDLSDRSDGFDAIVRQEDGTLEIRSVAAEESEAQRSRMTLRRIRELASSQSYAPVSGTYADADLAAIAQAPGIRELGGAAAIEGRRRLQLQLGTPIDGAVHLIDGPITPEVLDLLPGDAVLLPSRAVGTPELGPDVELEEPVRSLRAPSGRLLTALVADPYLERTLAAARHRAGPLVTAQRTLAESAMAYLEAPRVPDRGLILLPPSNWDPSPRAASTLLTGLRDATWLRLSPPGTIASDARTSRSSPQLAAPTEGPFRSELVSALRQASVGLISLEAALPEPGTRIQGRSLDALRDDLLRATSRWYRGPTPGESDALVRDVQHAIDTTLGDVEVTSAAVTLTSDTGQVPVTLQRTRGGDIQVIARVESQGRLRWPEGRTSETLLLPEGGSQTVTFPTRALSTGTFPVTVRVTDPSGTTVLATRTLSVRSTAISGAALSGTALLVIVLLLFGAFRRRGRRPPPLDAVAGP